MTRKIIVIALILSVILTCGADSEAAKRRRRSSSTTTPAVADSVLPKRGDIAVLVEGDDEQQVRLTETRIIDSLISHGYRVVDEKKMKAARAAAVKAQAVRLAMQGNYNAIFKLNAGYSCAATVVARIQSGSPMQDPEFKLYVANASISIIALTSRGTKLGGKTAVSKEVGYTEYEAVMKCIESAVNEGMKQLY